MNGLAAPPAAVRHRLRVTGVVQGVGFRPFVHRLATELALGGHVGNDSGGVFVEVEGSLPDVACFERRLVDDAPPMARVAAVDKTAVLPLGEHMFKILESRSSATARTFVAPDVAVCEDCLSELFDPADRRYRYPFINCTNCGPRFTIIVRLPYDRPNTTMSGFELCEACAAEYNDPADRQVPRAAGEAAACGPGISSPTAVSVAALRMRPCLLSRGYRQSDLAAAHSRAWRAGRVLAAVKGLGGYHLMCDATSDLGHPRRRLRSRKARPDKPSGCDGPRRSWCASSSRISDAAEAAALGGPARPIVLLLVDLYGDPAQ